VNKFSLGGQILGGIILFVIGLLLLTGILQAIVSFVITLLGWLFIIAGIVLGVMGIIRFFNKKD
jgi:hypothetical protein